MVSSVSDMNIPRGKYIRLNKALCGLKQAAKQWIMFISIYILPMGFIHVVSDSCMYVRGNYAVLLPNAIILYVDDMSIAAKHRKVL